MAEPQGVLANRWYFDAVYDRLFVSGTMKLSQMAANADRNDSAGRRITLDGVMSSAVTATGVIGSKLRKIQSGRIRHYMLVLLVVCATVAMFVALRIGR